MSWSDRLFRALVRVLPAEFRDAYLRDMEATFRAERRRVADEGAAGPRCAIRLARLVGGDGRRRGSHGAVRTLVTLLYGVPPLDPAAFAGSVATLVGCALLACLPPASRAARIDPVEAMRAE